MLGACALLSAARVALGQSSDPAATSAPDRSSLPIPLQRFEATIGKIYQQSEPAWKNPLAAPEGAPKVTLERAVDRFIMRLGV
jgi:hypothetical protein